MVDRHPKLVAPQSPQPARYPDQFPDQHWQDAGTSDDSAVEEKIVRYLISGRIPSPRFTASDVVRPLHNFTISRIKDVLPTLLSMVQRGLLIGEGPGYPWKGHRAYHVSHDLASRTTAIMHGCREPNYCRAAPVIIRPRDGALPSPEYCGIGDADLLAHHGTTDPAAAVEALGVGADVPWGVFRCGDGTEWLFRNGPGIRPFLERNPVTGALTRHDDPEVHVHVWNAVHEEYLWDESAPDLDRARRVLLDWITPKIPS